MLVLNSTENNNKTINSQQNRQKVKYKKNPKPEKTCVQTKQFDLEQTEWVVIR